MNDGLAKQMVYGDGGNNTIKHYYVGAKKTSKKKSKKDKKNKAKLKSSFV